MKWQQLHLIEPLQYQGNTLGNQSLWSENDWISVALVGKFWKHHSLYQHRQLGKHTSWEKYGNKKSNLLHFASFQNSSFSFHPQSCIRNFFNSSTTALTLAMCEVVSWLVYLRKNAWFVESNKLDVISKNILSIFLEGNKQVSKDLSISNTLGSTNCHKTTQSWKSSVFHWFLLFAGISLASFSKWS